MTWPPTREQIEAANQTIVDADCIADGHRIDQYITVDGTPIEGICRCGRIRWQPIARPA